MALHNVLPFAVPARPLVGRRQRARPADVIPLRPRLGRRRRPLRTLLFAVAAGVLWAATILVGLLAFRADYAAMGDLRSSWVWGPIW